MRKETKKEDARESKEGKENHAFDAEKVFIILLQSYNKGLYNENPSQKTPEKTNRKKHI